MVRLLHNLIPTLWLLWCLYWWLAAVNVKASVRDERIGSRLTHMLPLFVAGWLIAAPRVPGPLALRFVHWSFTVYWCGVALLAVGLAVSVWARVVLGRNWSARVTLKQDHELVETGPYRWIRHPIYTGILLAFAGSALARAEWRGLLALLIATAALARKIRIEERWLTELFGARYQDYSRRSWALFPGLW
jgi:protein-S-isoprenylcysteine O-methyltransferase Ste14